MSTSKAWDWKNTANRAIWLAPCEESYYLASRWKEKQYRSVLDLGCGLGRHSIFFAKCGFTVSAFDLSPEGTQHLKDWAAREDLQIDVKNADMLHIPYPDNSFDCVFAFHVISHTDTAGIHKILAEIRRVLKSGGEFYLTLCSKESWSFQDARFPRIDENTVVKTEEGPEKGIPHFYTDLDGILELFAEFSLIRVRKTDDCFFDGKKQCSVHYYILGSCSK